MDTANYLRRQGRRISRGDANVRVSPEDRLVSPSYDWRRRKAWQRYLDGREAKAAAHRQRMEALRRGPTDPSLTNLGRERASRSLESEKAERS